MMFSILDRQFNTLGVMDNSLTGAIHFFNDEFHQYLAEGGATFDFTVFKDHEDVRHIVEGNYIHFNHKDRDYLMTVRRTEEDEFKLDVYTESLNFDLLNEYAPAYKAPNARKITDYLNDILKGSNVVVGFNEVASFTRTLSWDGQATVLERVLSIVNYFDAEAEFVAIVNDDLTLNKMQLNIYRKYSDTTQGVGENRTDIELRYGENVNTIRRTVDITELYTAIRPIGTEGLTIKTIAETIKDDNGNVLFYTKSGSEWIFAPQANMRFGVSQNESTGFIQKPYDYDTASVNTLYGNALSQLKKFSEPAVTYEVEGYFDLNVGDTVSIADDKYNPILLLEARVSEMIISFANPEKNKTVFSNYRVFESQISSDLMERMKNLEELANQLQFRIAVTGSTILKNGEGSVNLTAIVEQATRNVADDFNEYNWIKRDKDGVLDVTWNNAHKNLSKSITITGADVNQSATFSYEVNVNNTFVGNATVVVANVYDGADGKGIKETTVSYQASASGTTPPTGNWLESPPSVNAGQYLWTKTEMIFDDDTTSIAYSVSRMGQNGTNGVGIKSHDVEYQSGTSGTTPPTGTWSTTVPSVSQNQFLWTRATIAYTDDSKSVSYSVGRMGMDGTDAKLLYLTATAEQMAFDTNNVVKSQTITISAKLQNITGTATFTATPYIGNTAQTTIALGGTGNNRTLSSTQFNKDWTLVAITATLSGLTDTLSIVKVTDGAKGDSGADGLPGKDGVGIKSTVIQYAQSTSGTTAPTTGWAAQVPTLVKGQYLWTRTTWTYTDNSTETGHSVSYNAKDGIAGKDAVEVISGFLTNEAIILPANASGVVSDFSQAKGNFNVYEGNIGISTGVAYALVSQTGITSTINATTGAYSVTAVPGDTGTAIYKATYKDITVERILIVVKSKQGTTGQTGGTGPTGPPTGITVSATEPSSSVRYVGMLWLNTGTAGGRIQNATYRWSGSEWTLFILTADNISATNLAAIRAVLGDVTAGTITNAGSITDGNTKINYETVLAGNIDMSWKLDGATQNGLLSVRPDALRSNSFNDAAKTQPLWAWSIDSGGLYVATKGRSDTILSNTTHYGPGGINISNSDFNAYGPVNLGYQDLITIESTTISETNPSQFLHYSSSALNQPRVSRNMRNVQLTGAFRNLNQLAAGVEGIVMGTVPAWARPQASINQLVQGTGHNIYLLTINVNGELTFNRYRGDVGGGKYDYKVCGAGAWLNIACMYTAGNL